MPQHFMVRLKAVRRQKGSDRMQSIEETLAQLPFEEEELGETVAQTLDLLAQALEQLDMRLRGSDAATRRSFGDHARNLEHLKAPSTLVSQLNALRKHRKTLTPTELQKEGVEQLVALAQGFVESSGTGQVEGERRVRYRPHLTNTVGVETASVFREFQLHHGSVIQVPCDALVISARLDAEGKADGQVANALKWRYGFSLDPNAILLRHSEEVWVTHQRIENPLAPFSHVLVLWMPSDADRTKALYEEALQTVFAALLALEHMGLELRRVGLSYLGGHRVQELDSAVETLIFAAIHWLKKADRAEVICCTLLQKEELDRWNEAMNQALGRAFAGVDGDPVMVALQSEVLSLVRKHRDGVLRPALHPLLEALQVQGPLCIELVCTFSRTLCEVTVRECLKEAGKKTSGDLLSSIENLRKTGKVAPWVCSYMHGLRVLGNKSVHPAHKPPKYHPKTLGAADLVSALAAVRCLLTFWDSRTGEG
jgi:hypothetical protein